MASALLCGSAVAALPQVEWVGIEVNAASYNGFEYETDGNNVTITKYTGNAKSVAIPSSINGKKVTAIGDYAFQWCDLNSVTIPNSVTSIGALAFGYCSNLKGVTIPGSVNSIGGDAFSCSGLTSLTISNGVKSIGRQAFYACENLTSVTIPGSVASIEYNTFMDCKKLKSVTISSGVKIIDGYAFHACDSLSSVSIPNTVTNIKAGAFNGCINLKSVIIPASVTQIDAEAFLSCTGLTSLTISNGVKSIGESAFRACGNLTSVTIPGSVASIGEKAFKDCGKLANVTISGGVKSIGDYAFNWCENLKSVTIPSSVTSIGEGVFRFAGNDSAPLTVYAPSGSAAEKYAKNNKIRFVVKADPKALILNSTQMTLGKGETTKLTATVNLSNKTVAWRTSNSKVATVDQNGNVKSVGIGQVWITAKASNGFEQSCKITVKNAPSKITLTKGILTIGVGEKYTLGASVNDGAGCAKRTYRTSNSSIVKMTRTDWNGDFYGVKPGVAYVTVRTYNGKESTCKVTVRAAPTSVTISKKTLNLKVGATATLSCSIPSNAGCALRTFRTSNSNVVKMTKTNWTGSFKAVAPGTAYVTVRTYNGKESTCKVTVTR